MERLGANYQKTGPGILRKIPQEDLDEIHRIFEVTEGMARFEKIEEYSKKKAQELGFNLDEDGNDYINHIYYFQLKVTYQKE